MSAAGRRTWAKSVMGDEIADAARNELPVVGLRVKGPLAFFRSLPRACIGFLFSVFIDVFVMVAYGSVLLLTGVGTSSFYFAALILSSCATLVYFSISAIRTENTVELLAALAITTCVNATVIYFRANEDAFGPVQRRGTNVFSSSGDLVPPDLLNGSILAGTALLQLALMWFGYLSYHDFGWRIFKLFGTDFNMRQVYERFLWVIAMLKLDTLMALLNVAAGFAFFFQHFVYLYEYTLMGIGIIGNMLWVLCCFVAIKLEYRVLTTSLVPLGLVSPLYLTWKAYDLYTVRSEGIAALGDDYVGKYHDVWAEPILATLGLGVIARLILLVLMMQTRRNFGTGLKNFSMHREYILPERLRAALSPDHAEGIKAMVRGLQLIGSLELREYAAAAGTAFTGTAAGTAAGGGTHGTEHGRHRLFTNRRRFFQLSTDLTTLRWSWREYLLLDEVVRVTPCADKDSEDSFELHAGTVFQRRVLKLRCGSAAEASLLITSFRSLLRLMSLGDRAFTMYVLQLFKLADRDALGAITSKNRSMGLGFLNLELPRDEEVRQLDGLGLQASAMLDFRELLALIRRVERPPLVARLYEKHARRHGGALDREALIRLWKEEQLEAPDEAVLRDFERLKTSNGTVSEGALWYLLLAPSNDVADPARVKTVFQDMTKPLPHYFIHSSHKTYLGKQSELEFPSSLEMIARSLLLGCRLLELDVWDSTGSEPEVHHQHTLAAHLPLSDVLETISRHAFVTSPYPLIISLNLLCTAAQQRTTASLLRAAFGKALYRPSGGSGVDGEPPGGAMDSMPSPEALRHRILVRGVPGSVAAESEEQALEESESFIVNTHGQQLGAAGGAAAAAVPAAATGTGTGTGTGTSTGTGTGVGTGVAGASAKGHSRRAAEHRAAEVLGAKIDPELLSLLSMVGRAKHGGAREGAAARAARCVMFKSDVDSEADGGAAQDGLSGSRGTTAWHVPSISETEAMQRLAVNAQAWVLHNASHVSAVAMRAASVDESSLDVIACWDAGCQIVPLSVPMGGAPLQLGSGKFMLNGGCGYVLKPRRLRTVSDAGAAPDALPKKLHKLQLKLICAVHLPKAGQRRVEREDWQTDECPLVAEHELSAAPVVSPCVVVEVRGGTFAAAGAELDECVHGDVWTSRTVMHNGLAPCWMQTVEIGVTDPELAVIRCSVWDRGRAGGNGGSSEAAFLCYAALPFCALRSGYRNVSMRDAQGCKVAFCKMLWHVRASHTHLPQSLRDAARATA